MTSSQIQRKPRLMPEEEYQILYREKERKETSLRRLIVLFYIVRLPHHFFDYSTKRTIPLCRSLRANIFWLPIRTNNTHKFQPADAALTYSAVFSYGRVCRKLFSCVQTTQSFLNERRWTNHACPAMHCT